MCRVSSVPSATENQYHLQLLLRSKVENSNSAYVKLCLYSTNIPGFQTQIDLIRVNFKQIHDEVGPNKVKYPTYEELGFLESKYKLIMSSVFKHS